MKPGSPLDAQTPERPRQPLLPTRPRRTGGTPGRESARRRAPAEPGGHRSPLPPLNQPRYRPLVLARRISDRPIGPAQPAGRRCRVRATPDAAACTRHRPPAHGAPAGRSRQAKRAVPDDLHAGACAAATAVGGAESAIWRGRHAEVDVPNQVLWSTRSAMPGGSWPVGTVTSCERGSGAVRAAGAGALGSAANVFQAGLGGLLGDHGSTQKGVRDGISGSVLCRLSRPAAQPAQHGFPHLPGDPDRDRDRRGAGLGARLPVR
jgi:hypothetical protein